MAFTKQQLLGLTESHLIELYPNHKVHIDVVNAITDLQKASREAGFDLRLASSFRSFERQKTIWNKKAKGQLACFDKNERPLDISACSPFELADTICFFSAIPGTSRHHWGCDFDIFDFNAYPAGKTPQLKQSEFTPGGENFPVYQWLLKHAADFGFYFPFTQTHDGVCPEPWHISFKPVSELAQKQYSKHLLIDILSTQPVLLADVILKYIDYFYPKYIGQYHV